MATTPIAMAVHGGAWSIPDDLVAGHEAGCRRALAAGWEVLRRGGTALDAVEAAVRILEDDTVFDAGTGSHLNRDGIVENEAAIMDGGSLRAGSVTALRAIRNPVAVARRLLDSGAAVMMTGEGALRWAVEQGFERIGDEPLVVPRERARWQASRAAADAGKTGASAGETAGAVFGGDSSAPLGTVGAVALDRAGHVAAATSTGGTPYKHPGRVGDGALLGCGTFADDASGAISCTGWGESIMRVVLARRAAEAIERGLSAQSAAEHAVKLLADRVGGLGGLIVVSPGLHRPHESSTSETIRPGEEAGSGSRPQEMRPSDTTPGESRGGLRAVRMPGGPPAHSPIGVFFNTSRMARGIAVEGREPMVAVLP